MKALLIGSDIRFQRQCVPVFDNFQLHRPSPSLSSRSTQSLLKLFGLFPTAAHHTWISFITDVFVANRGTASAVENTKVSKIIYEILAGI